jgi:hypothetical protein
MQVGDDVYFKCGTKLEASSILYVSWEGTSENPAIIGAYHMASGNPRYYVSGNRPIISGRNYSVPSNICQGGANDTWLGLVEVQSRDYVHIKDLHIYKSGWAGIRIEGDLQQSSSNTGFLIDNCKIEGAYYTGIWINKSKNNHGTISNCEVTSVNVGYGELRDNSGDRCESDWGAGITVTNSPYAYTTIKNNYVHDQYGEGISSTRVFTGSNTNHCGYVTIEDNVVWNNRRVDVYINLTEGNIVRRNILAGTNSAKYRSAQEDNRSWNQWGIWINNEYRSTPLPNDNKNNKVYGNLVAGHYVGIGLSSYYDSGTMENQYIYNNTAIGNKINFYIGKTISSYNTKNIVFKNNISYCPDDTICDDVNNDPSWFDGKITANYNAWTKKPQNWSGANDVLTNNKWIKNNGWQDLSSSPTHYDFMPTSGNPVVNSGTALAAPYDTMIFAKDTKYQTAPLEIVVNTFNNGNGDQWDMGGIQNQGDTAALPLQDQDNVGYLEPPTLSISETR